MSELRYVRIKKGLFEVVLLRFGVVEPGTGASIDNDVA